MEPDLPSRRSCDQCGCDEDLYLVTFATTAATEPGEAHVLCSACRAQRSLDVALPLSLTTPRLILGLQRLRKLGGNLSRLLHE